MTNQTTLDRSSIASDFASRMAGILPSNVLAGAKAALASQPLVAAANTAYPANGSIAAVVIWTKCQCTIKGGKTFDGSSWGIAFPGGGALFGDVYTDDLNALYANTRSFAMVATPVYTSFVFFDGNHNTLGSFQAGSISVTAGTGGGSGSWS